MSEKSKRAVTVRLETDLYEALEEAGALRGSTNMSEIIREAVLRYVAESAADVDLVAEVERKQAALRARAQALRDATPRRAGSTPSTGGGTPRGRSAAPKSPDADTTPGTGRNGHSGRSRG